MQTDQGRPMVTIGLPVYNGERYLVQAIESILAQSFEDFELIISDNASTDGTEAICQDYAARDPRVRYHRNVRNLGAVANFNSVFKRASCRYFKWAAHDDMIAPGFIEACVAVLEANPKAVLCCPKVSRIDQHGTTFAVVAHDLVGAEADSVPERYRVLISKVRTCREIFGLIRAEALKRTQLHEGYEGEDKALLAELALLGRFIEHPEPLFWHREHPERFVHQTRIHKAGYAEIDADKLLAWYDPSKAGKRMPYNWRLLLAYFGMVGRHVETFGARLRCYRHLVSWSFEGRRWARLLLEPIFAIDPRFARFFERLKATARRKSGPAADYRP